LRSRLLQFRRNRCPASARRPDPLPTSAPRAKDAVVSKAVLPRLDPRASVEAHVAAYVDALNQVGFSGEIQRTAAIREALPALLRELHIMTMIDAPCGDLKWFKRSTLSADGTSTLKRSHTSLLSCFGLGISGSDRKPSRSVFPMWRVGSAFCQSLTRLRECWVRLRTDPHAWSNAVRISGQRASGNEQISAPRRSR
jgi:hypothetical protein